MMWMCGGCCADGADVCPVRAVGTDTQKVIEREIQTKKANRKVVKVNMPRSDMVGGGGV